MTQFGSSLWLSHIPLYICASSGQFSRSVVSDSLQPHGLAAHQASLSITKSQNFLKFTSIELVMPSNHLILCPPLLLLPSIFPSLRVYSNESALPTTSWFILLLMDMKVVSLSSLILNSAAVKTAVHVFVNYGFPWVCAQYREQMYGCQGAREEVGRTETLGLTYTHYWYNTQNT